MCCASEEQPYPRELGVDLRATRLRALMLLQHQHARRLAHHEAVALEVERPRRGSRVVVPPRQRAHRSEAGDADLGHRRLRAAAEHHVRASEPDRVQAVADRHVRGGARRALRSQRPTSPELDRHPAGADVRDDRRDRERVHAVRAALAQRRVAVLERLQPADAGRDRRADAVRLGGDVERRVVLRLPRGSDDHLREAVHAPRGLASIQSVGSKSFSSQAKWTEYALASNCVIGPAPDCPERGSATTSARRCRAA